MLGLTPSVSLLRYTYARTLAALTEFWRCQRECAAVMHFCALSYSRAGGVERPVSGATSDHFIGLESLNFETNFETYVRDAFAPVGLMIDIWEDSFKAGETMKVPVIIINDLYEDWQGTIRLNLRRENEPVGRQIESCTVESLGKNIVYFQVVLPNLPGSYQLVAEHSYEEGNTPVRSLRDFNIQ
jgi:hypothetical protein